MNLHESKTYISDLDVAIEQTVGLEKLKGKKMLITGATGTIGSFVVDVLLRYNQTENTDISVCVAGRNVEKIEKLYYGFGEITALSYDINNEIGFDVPVDYIIHAAGNAHPAAFNSGPVETIIGSINSTYNLLRYARKYSTKRLLYISSGEVYGQGNLDVDEFDEAYAGYLDMQSPRSCYPSSKRAAENLCASYSRQYGLETVVVRPCHTYGPFITPSDNRANVQFIRNVLDGEDIVMKSAGVQMRSYNYIADCVSAILTVLINGNSGEAYNIANPYCRVTIAGLAETIAKAVGRRVVFDNPDAVDFANRTPIEKQVLSSKKIEALGWKGAFTVRTGIKHTIDILQGL